MRTELAVLLLLSLVYHGESSATRPNAGLGAADERSKTMKEAKRWKKQRGERSREPKRRADSWSAISMEVVLDTFLDLAVYMQSKLVINSACTV